MLVELEFFLKPSKRCTLCAGAAVPPLLGAGEPREPACQCTRFYNDQIDVARDVIWPELRINRLQSQMEREDWTTAGPTGAHTRYTRQVLVPCPISTESRSEVSRRHPGDAQGYSLLYWGGDDGREGACLALNNPPPPTPPVHVVITCPTCSGL